MSTDNTAPAPVTVTVEEYKQAMNELAQARLAVDRLQLEAQQRLQEQQAQSLEQQRRHAARARDMRRQSQGMPLLGYATPAPAVSSLTESAAARLNTVTPMGQRTQSQHRGVAFASPSTRPQPDDVYGSEEDDGPILAAAPLPNAEDERRKQEIIGKAMRRMPAPDKFRGDTNDDKDRVEAWCTQVTSYLDSQFYGISRDEVKVERMTLVLGLLDKPASTWVNNMYSEERGDSWEDIQPLFITTVRDGRDTPAALRQRMDSLAFGRGKCRDLLSFNQEFETLRMKLYPTSSTDLAMSQVSADYYGKAIRRGDPELYVEALRFLTIAAGLNQDRQPELREWKAAAADAVRIRDVQREAQRAIQANSGGRGGWRAERAAANQLQQQTAPGPAAHCQGPDAEPQTWERQEGEQDAGAVGDAQANAVGTRRQGEPHAGGRPQQQQRPRYLPEDEVTKLRAAGRCFKCYQKGHRSSDASCPGRGKPHQRRPTTEELKA